MRIRNPFLRDVNELLGPEKKGRTTLGSQRGRSARNPAPEKYEAPKSYVVEGVAVPGGMAQRIARRAIKKGLPPPPIPALPEPQSLADLPLAPLSPPLPSKRLAQERQIARAVQEILAREGREDGWKEAVSMLADCAISAARDNVDAEYAMSLVEYDARTWYSDLRDEGDFWVRPALAGMIGEPDEWLSYIKSVYQTINPEILKGAIELTEKRKRSGKTWAVREFDSVLKAKAMTAKRAKEVGLPDFHVAAQKAVAFAKKYASENLQDFRDYAEADSMDLIRGWDDEQVTYCAGFGDEIRGWAGELKVSDWRDFRKELNRALVAEALNVLRDRVVRVGVE